MTKLCKLCETNEANSKHHIFPKYVIKKINPDCNMADYKIGLCEDCHNEIHESFINHIIMKNKKVKNNNDDRFIVLRYTLLRQFIKDQDYDLFGCHLFFEEG